MLSEVELIQAIEGVDDTGAAKAACCLSIMKNPAMGEPEALYSAATLDAVVSICLTEQWAVVDLQFSEPLDYDFLRMAQVCKVYTDSLRRLDGNSSVSYSFVLSLAPVGDYDIFLVGADGFWSFMASVPAAGCDTIRFLFPRDRFGAFELDTDAVEEMIEEAGTEIREFGEE